MIDLIMPKIISFILFFAIGSSAFAQASNNKLFSRAVKINLNYRTTFGNGFTFGNPAPSFMRSTKRNHFHEIEMNSFDMDKTIAPIHDGFGQRIGEVVTRRLDIGLRYQFTFNFLKNARLNPQAGISFLSRYQRNYNEPSVPSSYPRKHQRWDSRLALCPQLRYNISA